MPDICVPEEILLAVHPHSTNNNLVLIGPSGKGLTIRNSGRHQVFSSGEVESINHGANFVLRHIDYPNEFRVGGLYVQAKSLTQNYVNDLGRNMYSFFGGSGFDKERYWWPLHGNDFSRVDCYPRDAKGEYLEVVHLGE
jgi:hypothetical protein